MMTQPADMTVTSLQLAVISGHISIVEKLLSMVSTSSDKAGGETSLSLIVDQKTIVEFEDNKTDRYGEGDRMLHGCSAFHLAARFHADSLKLFVKHLDKSSDLRSIISEKGQHKVHPMRYSAVHLAACNSSPDGLRQVYKFALILTIEIFMSYLFP